MMKRFVVLIALFVVFLFLTAFRVPAEYSVALLEDTVPWEKASIVPVQLTIAEINQQQLEAKSSLTVTQNRYDWPISQITAFPKRYQVIMWRCDYPSSGTVMICSVRPPFTTTVLPIGFPPVLGGSLVDRNDGVALLVANRSPLAGGGSYVSRMEDGGFVSTPGDTVDWGEVLMMGGPHNETIPVDWQKDKSTLVLARGHARLPISFDLDVAREVDDLNLDLFHLSCNDANALVIGSVLPAAEDAHAIEATIFFIYDKIACRWHIVYLADSRGRYVKILSNDMLCVGESAEPKPTGHYLFLTREGKQLAEWKLPLESVLIDCWDMKAIYRDGEDLFEATLGKTGPEDKKLLLHSPRVRSIIALFKS